VVESIDLDTLHTPLFFFMARKVVHRRNECARSGAWAGSLSSRPFDNNG
jgi:hypothetical protein